MTNTWPYKKHAMLQTDHKAWNVRHYPGTRQVCCQCARPTTYCEEDGLWTDGGKGPFCNGCWDVKMSEMVKDD